MARNIFWTDMSTHAKQKHSRFEFNTDNTITSRRTNIDPIYLLIVLLELAENHEHTDKKLGKFRQELIDYFQFWSYPKIHLLLSVDYKFVLFVMGNVY